MRTFLALTLLGVAACGGGTQTTPDAAVVDNGFNKPDKPLMANMESGGVWTEIGPADLSCLGTPTDDQATAVEVTLNAIVKDFQSGNAVPNAAVTLFDGVDPSAMFAMGTSDSSGDATFTVPAGHTRFGFKMTTTDGFVMPTLLLNQYLDPNAATQPPGTCTDDNGDPTTCRMTIQSVSTSTASTLPAIIGVSRTTGTGVLAGALRDCQQHEMSNFIATVSSTEGTATPLAGAAAYYFSASVGLPAHHSQQDAASGDGLFMVIELPATPTAYVQMWGYPTQADIDADNLKLIAELQVPVLPDTVITGSYEPLRQ
jgi:hypothetical protein